MIALMAATLAALLAVDAAAAAERPPRLYELPYIDFWSQPVTPFHIAGPIYYVGTQGLGVYLITTDAGHILIDAALPQSGFAIAQNIQALGFKTDDLRKLLITHAHVDHAGSLAYLKRLTKAEVVVMAGDAEEIADGGASDPWFGGDPSWHFRPVKADRIIHDGDTVSVGGVTLTARLGAGHTRGATTWTMTFNEGGRSYNVVFPCCVGVNSGVKLTGEAALYPGVVDDYRRTFAMLKSLTPDIFLPAHTETFPIADYIERAKTEGAAGWVDPATYREWLAANEAAFEQALAR